MAEIDGLKERQRLAKRFAGMSDGDLQKAGRDPAALTKWAFDVLSAEMALRDLGWAGKGETLASVREREKRKRHGPGDTPVVLRGYLDMAGAMADRMALESAGIECYLYDENLVRMDWLISNGIGGMKLGVKQSDVQDAARILDGDSQGELGGGNLTESRPEIIHLLSSGPYI
jgi:hypothetical protein